MKWALARHDQTMTSHYFTIHILQKYAHSVSNDEGSSHCGRQQQNFVYLAHSNRYTISFRFAFLLLWINCFGDGDCFSYNLEQLCYHSVATGRDTHAYTLTHAMPYSFALGSWTIRKLPKDFICHTFTFERKRKQWMLRWATLCAAREKFGEMLPFNAPKLVAKSHNKYVGAAERI